MLSREERKQKIKEANYNLFKLSGEDCYIDLLTDSGTGAMSMYQWSGLMRGDEAYAGASSYFKLIDTAKDITGFGYVQPVHQGRAAEKVLMPMFLGKGKFAISNMFFDTTRAHVELAGARAVDCVVPEALDPQKRAPFKGNMDVPRLEKLINELGAENVGMVVMTVTNNSAGGQPVSMRNIRETAEVCRKYGILFDIDAARYAENAYFIKRDESGYQDRSIKEIIREMFSCADMFTMSAKKDAIVNMGGLIGVKEPDSPRILEIKAGCIEYEIGQQEYMAAKLDDAGIAYQSPVGGHGIFLDARAMFPNIPYDQFPGQALAIELYKEAGIRSCDIGSYMLGNDPDTGKQLKADFEFTRLAMPRRVYTQAHLDIVVDACISIKEHAASVTKGYRITWEPPILRHFQAHLEPIK